MTFYKFLTTSKSIVSIPNISIFLSGSIANYKKNLDCYSLVGWGKKKSGLAAIKLAKEKSKTHLLLEDGFIGYWGHPRDAHLRLSLIIDNSGIYYDSNGESDLEKIINALSLSESQKARSERLIATIRDFNITKYNRHFVQSSLLNKIDRYVLLVDQSQNDESIKYGQASSKSFLWMLETALSENPESTVIIKSHPDQKKKNKKGYFGDVNHPRVVKLMDDVAPIDIFARAEVVYTVTSQFGFEALLHRKKVVCFGMPFYAGWGLTDDRVLASSRRLRKITLQELVYGALISYPAYVHPERLEKCNPEDVIEWIISRRAWPTKLAAYGFSFWKKSFVNQFIGLNKNNIRFIKSLNQVKNGDQEQIITWGANNFYKIRKKYPDKQVLIMEDGFLRSVGLGSDLKRPSSLVVDSSGIYYDSTSPSDIEEILSNIKLSESQFQRSRELIQKIISLTITKYNVGASLNAEVSNVIKLERQHREVILVTGQLHTDASIKYGSPIVKTNRHLIERVRADNPGGFLIYKAHPDVVSGNKGDLKELAYAQEQCDLILENIHISELYSLVDKVCVTTSLAGFEALLRGLPVTCYGLPFYAGWGLTEDMLEIQRRARSLTIEELAYGALIDYPKYINWKDSKLTTPENLLHGLSETQVKAGSNYLGRLSRKLKYFAETIFH